MRRFHVLSEARLGHEGRARVVGRGKYSANPHPRRGAGGRKLHRHIGPAHAAVCRHLDLSVVRPGPKDSGFYGRFRKRRDRAEEDEARSALPLLVVCRQVGADLGPVVAAVERPEDDLGRRVNGRRIVRRKDDGRRPIETRGLSLLLALWSDERLDAELLVQPPHRAHFPIVIQPAAVGRVDAVVHPVASADRHPVRQADLSRPAVRRAFPGVVVLQPAIDVVGILHVHADGIELAERDVIEVMAGLTAVVGDVHPSVGAEDQAVRVLGIDPQGSPVAEGLLKKAVRRPGNAMPGLAAVGRAGQRLGGDVELIRIVLVHAELVEGIRGLVERLLRALGVDLAPGLASVIGPIDFAPDSARLRLDTPTLGPFDFPGRGRPHVGVLDDGVENVRILLEDVEADAADLAHGQSAAELGPGLAAVGCFVDAALRAAWLVMPGETSLFIGRGVKDLRVFPDEGQVDDSDLIIYIKDFLPGLTAIRRLEDAALLVRREQVSH